MGKPLITRRNAPVQELLIHGESAIFVEPANPQALADAILRLKGDPELRKSIGERGYEKFLQNGTVEKLGEGLERILKEAIGPV
jgi:glycosyltransferase involved in cell wall biosynthesis